MWEGWEKGRALGREKMQGKEGDRREGRGREEKGRDGTLICQNESLAVHVLPPLSLSSWLSSEGLK